MNVRHVMRFTAGAERPPPSHQRRPLTFSCRATSGLNAGVLMNCRNSVEIRFLSPSRLVDFTLRVIRSTSLSIKVTMSRVS